MLPRTRSGSSKSFLARQRIGYEVTDQGNIWKGVELNEPRSKFSNARIFDIAVDQHGALFTDIGVEAAKPYCQIGIILEPDADEAVQNQISIFECYVELIVATMVAIGATPDPKSSGLDRAGDVFV